MQTQKKNAEAPKTQEEWGMGMIEATQQQKQQLKVMRRMESKDRDRGKNTKNKNLYHRNLLVITDGRTSSCSRVFW